MADSIGFAVVIFLAFCGCKLCAAPIQKKDKEELGVRRANLIYTDEKGCKLLKASHYGLQGKPDYIFETWGLKKLIPLEVKSAVLKEDWPHQGDLMQLIAYFLIIEEVYGKRPPYGKLVYKNKTFTVKNTKKMRKELLKTVKVMQQMLDGKVTPKVTPSFKHCKNCICQQTVCEWSKK